MNHFCNGLKLIVVYVHYCVQLEFVVHKLSKVQGHTCTRLQKHVHKKTFRLEIPHNCIFNQSSLLYNTTRIDNQIDHIAFPLQRQMNVDRMIELQMLMLYVHMQLAFFIFPWRIPHQPSYVHVQSRHTQSNNGLTCKMWHSTI